MATDPQLSAADRIVALLDHLGIQQAHVAGAIPADWRDLAAGHSERVSSLSLICPIGFDPNAVADMASRVLVFHGDRSPVAERVRASVERVPEATLVILENYAGHLWADVTAERNVEIGPALLDFIRRMGPERARAARAASALSPGSGEIAGLSYDVQGSGPPLVLLPLALAPSQWDPLLPLLREHFSTIQLRGPHLGMMPLLEGRGQTPGYVRMVRNVFDEIALRPGETILDAGCGSGVLDRWVARHTNRAHPISAVDINRYLLHEADALIRKAGLQDTITLREGNAETLPFAENSFDVTVSFTVLEEGDADRMLRELVRVTKTGGRVAAIVRGEDWPMLLTLPLSPELHSKAVRTLGAGATEGGCADAGLYRRFHAAGLQHVQKVPQLAVYQDSGNVMVRNYEARILSVLTADEVKVWRAAVADAEVQGSFMIAVPHHCAVGTKP